MPFVVVVIAEPHISPILPRVQPGIVSAGTTCASVILLTPQNRAKSYGRKFVAAANEFIPLLRQHIYNENTILFQMAGNVLSEADDADLTDRFSKVERERDLDGTHERYDAEVAGWEKAMS